MTESKVYKSILEACKEIGKENSIKAICMYGSRVCGYARKDSDYDVLLILEKLRENVRYHYKKAENIQLAILAVDNKAIEKDAEKGVLGDFVAGRLITPYISLLNKEYLRDIELITKRRFVKEDLEDLIIEFGELARGLVIEPQYLVLVRMRKRSKAYPPLKYSYIHMLRSRFSEKNMNSILDGYHAVLHDLTKNKLIKFDGEYIVLNNSFIDNILSTKTLKRVTNLLKNYKKALYSYFTHGRAGKVPLDIIIKELASKIKRELIITIDKQNIEDPRNHLFLDTKDRLIKLSEKNTIKEIIYKIKNPREIKIHSFAGAMNDVYLVKVDNEKLIVKRFTDWFNMKWLALSIIAYGTKGFTLSGKARLSNEYGINHLLAEHNIPVPEIISIDIKERVLIEKYIEGKSILDIVKDAVKTQNLRKEQKKWAFKVGKLIAKIHSLDISLGDCKPENFIIHNNDKIYVIDLEQGERHGNKTWDVAEFCYFSGHYGNTLNEGLTQFISSFIEGYIQTGNKEILSKAAELGYERVFFAWTPIPIIYGISNLLKNEK